jgi:hypothetical protein
MKFGSKWPIFFFLELLFTIKVEASKIIGGPWTKPYSNLPSPFEYAYECVIAIALSLIFKKWFKITFQPISNIFKSSSIDGLFWTHVALILRFYVFHIFWEFEVQHLPERERAF